MLIFDKYITYMVDVGKSNSGSSCSLTSIHVETVKKNMAFANVVPAVLVRFIGSAELLGAIGLIVPAVTGIQSWLTVAAAGGLVLVMLLAAIYHASRREYSHIGVNVVLLLLAAFVLVGRWVLAPL
jgi:putative oxidoreductase